MRLVVLAAVLLAACATGADPESTGDGDGDRKPDADPEKPDAPVFRPPDGGSPPEPDADPGAPDASPAVPDAAPPDAPPAVVPDTCAEALDVTGAAMGGSGVTLAGDTSGLADDVRPASTCTGYIPDGADTIYVVSAGAGQTISATVTPAGWDTSIYVTSNCALTPTCVAGADVGLEGGVESVTYTTAAAGMYFVVVDGWNPGVEGPYSVNIRLQ